MLNNFSICISTVNGSGSQSANNIIAKSLFRLGLPVSAKNLFPSNIAGLPTWYTIRVHPEGFLSRRPLHDIVICKNDESLLEDMNSVVPGGIFIYDNDIKLNLELRADIQAFGVPYRELTRNLSDSVKMRKLLSNMIYTGILSELLKINSDIIKSVVKDQFSHREDVYSPNQSALDAGSAYAREHLKTIKNSSTVSPIENKNNDCIFIDGNSAAALGSVVGGATVLTWYPITPSSSLAENFSQFARELRPGAENKYAVVQAEDELSAINMVVGAGWAGARALTATSGPGLSLMAEAAGLAYFAEIPAVIWDVQRAGPSTGLPTRTLQGDVEFAANLSHGDTEHILLFPANPYECFEFAQLAFFLSDKLQTLIIVLSDLDIGMNYYVTQNFNISSDKLDRGKVLSAAQLNEIEKFARYKDVDGDGICYRTLPGTMHANAAYFTRGTGHNENSGYTENHEVFKKLLDRLKMKIHKGTEFLPEALLRKKATDQSSTLLVAYGSTDSAVSEVQSELLKANLSTDYLRLRAYPFAVNLVEVFSQYEQILILEQNRDGQMSNLLKKRFPKEAHKFNSILSYNGLPVCAEDLTNQIKEVLK